MTMTMQETIRKQFIVLLSALMLASGMAGFTLMMEQEDASAHCGYVSPKTPYQDGYGSDGNDIIASAYFSSCSHYTNVQVWLVSCQAQSSGGYGNCIAVNGGYQYTNGGVTKYVRTQCSYSHSSTKFYTSANGGNGWVNSTSIYRNANCN
ncbi:MAG: hypothetical protein M3440_06440 [Chloroflexota bacterium]|nr:hypothetical protein [Chloroflexota bacterium]